MILGLCVRQRTLALWLALPLVACTGAEPGRHVDPSEAVDASQPEGDARTPPSEDAGGALPAAADDAGSGSAGGRDASVSGEPRDAGGAATDASRPRDAGDAASAQDAASSDASLADPQHVADGLQGLFLDVPCAAATPTPLAQGATCAHPTGTQRIEKMVTLGGEPGQVYTITLRVRGIWEPTLIQGGQRPDKAHPFTIGGMLPPGTGSSDPISYQQYSLSVSEPKQTYWFNDHQYVAHDIHKEDYQASIRAAAGAHISVIMNDGNDHQIANFTKDYFVGLAPYDKAPSTGQSLRLDVVSVLSAP
jgi:hypothetical protein